MALLKILKYPEASLKEPAKEVANIDGRIASFIDSMTQTMYAAPGVGLAAPQVGSSQRVIVLDTEHDNRGKHLLKLINPEIVEAEGSILWEEGCLSVVDFTADVKRAAVADTFQIFFSGHQHDDLRSFSPSSGLALFIAQAATVLAGLASSWP